MTIDLSQLAFHCGADRPKLGCRFAHEFEGRNFVCATNGRSLVLVRCGRNYADTLIPDAGPDMSSVSGYLWPVGEFYDADLREFKRWLGPPPRPDEDLSMATCIRAGVECIQDEYVVTVHDGVFDRRQIAYALRMFDSPRVVRLKLIRDWFGTFIVIYGARKAHLAKWIAAVGGLARPQPNEVTNRWPEARVWDQYPEGAHGATSPVTAR